MIRKISVASLYAMMALLCSAGAAQAACAVTYTFSNGTTADANQVNQDFSDLINCAAPTASPVFSGSVGIGTGSPGDLLEVDRGNLGNDTGGITIKNSNPGGYGAWLAFSTNNGAGNAINSYVYGEGRTGAGGLIGFSTRTPSGTPTIGMRLYNGSTIELSTGYNSCSALTTNSTGVVQCAVSDQRLKRDIAPLTGGDMLQALSKLKPVSFYWKKEAQRDGDQQFGFIANQVQSVFPNLVTKTYPTALTPDGTLTINYDGLIAPTILAVQQLDVRTMDVPKLQRQVEDLRLELGHLRAAYDQEGANTKRLEARLEGLERRLNARTAQK